MRPSKFTIAILVLLAALLFGPGAQAEGSAPCADCHGPHSTRSQLPVDIAAFNNSVHASTVGCAGCHTQVKIKDGACVHGSGAVNCAQCHEQKNLHGAGSTEGNRPQCNDCHQPHAIFAKDDPRWALNPDHLAHICAKCHPAQSGQAGYLSWLPSLKIATHPKADLSGADFRNGNCMGCHQGRAAHGQSAPINHDSCPRCHMSGPHGKSSMLGVSHPQADPDRQPDVFVVALIYQMLIVAFLVGGIAFFVGKFSGTKKR